MASVMVPLAQGCEELEAVTIIDLLRRAKINVVTVGLDKEIVRASRGTRLIPDKTIDDVMTEEFDMIVLPGGLPGADNLNNDPRVHQMITKIYSTGKYVAAICAAPRVLARAGLLNGRRATSFPNTLQNESTTKMTYLEEPVVIDRNVITSRGPGTAMDFALALVELLSGKTARDQVESGLMRPHN